MVNIEALNLDYKVYQIILSYIKDMYNGDTLFSCVSGCNTRLLNYMRNHIDELRDLNPDYSIVPIFEGKFHEVVQIRNDRDKRKIVIFTNGSISNIDSLKDFIQIDMKKIPFKNIWSIIKNQYFADVDPKIKEKIECFLELLVLTAEPDIYMLVEYIKKADADNSKYKSPTFALNTNLYMLNMWSSSSNDFLKKSKLLTIYNNSVPYQIHRKIKSPTNINKLDSINRKLDNPFKSRFQSISNQKKILREMFYNRTYNDAYEAVDYELIQHIFKGNSKGPGKAIEKEDEESFAYTNIYEQVLSILTTIDNGNSVAIDIESLKACKNFRDLNLKITDARDETDDYIYKVQLPHQKNATNQTTIEDRFINLEEAKEKWRLFENIFMNKEYLSRSISEDDLLDICKNLQIVDKYRSELIAVLKVYLDTRCRVINTAIYPIDLDGLLDDNNTLEYVNAFYELIRTVYRLSPAIIKIVSEKGFLNKLINLDVRIKDSSIFVPYYSPLMLFHLYNMRKRYEICLRNIDSMNSHRLDILNQINSQVLNDHIIYNKKTYLLSQHNKDFPYYIKYDPEEYIESLSIINLNILAPLVLNYVNKHPYKNTLKLCLIGEVDFYSFKNILNKISMKKDNNLRNFKIRIVTQSSEDVLDRLISLFEQKEQLNLECTVEKVSRTEMESHIEEFIVDNDLTIFLDSSAMYEKSYVNKRKRDDQTPSIIKYRDINNEINLGFRFDDSNIEDIPITPNIINALQNSIESNGLQYWEREKHNLNSKLTSSFNTVLNKMSNMDKEVILISSDNHIDNQLLTNQNLIDISETMNINDKVKVMTFCKSPEDTTQYTFKATRQRIVFTAAKFIDSFQIDNSNTPYYIEGFDYENIKITLSYENPKYIDIAYSYIKASEDNNHLDKVEEQLHSIFTDFIKPSIKPKIFLDSYYRETFIRLLLRHALTEEDIVFIYTFERDHDVEVEYSGKTLLNQQIENDIISSISKNTLYRVLTFLGREAISEHSFNQFNELLEVNNFKIKYLPQLSNLISKYNHEQIKYLYKNICAVIRKLGDEFNEEV